MKAIYMCGLNFEREGQARVSAFDVCSTCVGNRDTAVDVRLCDDEVTVTRIRSEF